MQNTSGQKGQMPRKLLNFPAASRFMGLLLAHEPESEESLDFPEIPGYVIQRCLGQGGGGEVFLAYRESGSDSLAIKMMRKALGHRKADRRAWRELDILTDLRLAGVPTVHDYGVVEGRLFIVTAHVEGLTLDDHCRKNTLDLTQRVQLLASVADVVQNLNEQGVIHRDLKPDNIIIRSDGQPVIVDFGIASLLVEDQAESLTIAGNPIGTVGFMSPEQARGETHRVSTRSDVYGLGATAAFILTGQGPHDVEAPLHEAIRRVAQDAPRHPRELDPNLPSDLAEILARATASQPDDRYPSAALLAEDLRRWLRNEPIPWRKTSWVHRQMLSWRKNRRAFLAKAAIWFLVLTAFIASTAAVAEYKIASGERTNANEAAQLRQQAQELADQKTALLDQERQYKEAWKKQAEDLHASQNKLFEDVNAFREKMLLRKAQQVEILKTAIAQPTLYDATFIFMTLGEDIQANGYQDKELIDRYVSLMHEAIEKAKSKANSPSKED